MHITVLGVWRLQESSIARSGTAREVCQASSAPVQLRSARFLSARLRSLRGTSVPEHLNASRKPQACPPSAMSVSQSDDSQSAGRRAIADAFQGYKKQFSEVPDITPAELDSLRRSSATLTLIDVRTPEEQQVSMLPGAIPQQQFKQHLEEQDRDALTVTYCTAGLRSGKYAAELQRQGFSNVKNLQGSLVSWAHDGLPLVDPDGQPVKRFHAYGPAWADMAKGSGYDTVVHKQPLLKGAIDTVKGWWPV